MTRIDSVSGLVCSLACAAACSVALGCADSAQDRLVVSLDVAGTDVAANFETSRGVLVTLDRADLAFGPLYLCASTEAGSACDTARGEWLQSVVVDALDAQPQAAGELRAVTGAYRSFMYDLGIASLLTQNTPLVLPAAEALGGVSIVLEGRVDLAGVLTQFSLAMPIERTADNEVGVPVVRVRADSRNRHEITHADEQLLIRFDPRPWVHGIDFATLCADTQQCAALSPDGQAGRAVRLALTAGTPPRLSWNDASNP